MTENHAKILTKPDQIEKFFKLSGSINTTNMTLFNSNHKIVKYIAIAEICEDYYGKRIKGY